ncbi:vomeronasal type-2 receptor 26-like [Hyperolius riggenbachi]|uniref:vomeronasal type-2 receptor 26-like n=1 Tax=Hyperolius riggenbachi TaxID=752182 RepID=UPI0035A2E9D5
MAIRRIVNAIKTKQPNAGREIKTARLQLHCNRQEGSLYHFSSLTFQWLQSLLMAVAEINHSVSLLPNLTLGVHLSDSCASPGRALEGAMGILTGEGHLSVPNYRCLKKSTPLAGVIGDSSSASSLIVARLMGIYRYTQISYFSTSSVLSDRRQFPSFFRTVPSDLFQSQGLAQLVSFFGWRWVGLLAEDTDYGQEGIKATKAAILKSGACIAFTEYILTSHPDRNAPKLSQVIAESNATAVVVFSSGSNLLPVVEELLKLNIIGKIWISSESWSTSVLVSKGKYWSILQGTIGFALHSGQILGFKDFLNVVNPRKSPNDIYLREFWEENFGCKWETSEKNVSNNTKKCTGEESLENFLKSMSVLRVTYSVYIAVYALAWALQEVINKPLYDLCKDYSSPFPASVCSVFISMPTSSLSDPAPHYITCTRSEEDEGSGGKTGSRNGAACWERSQPKWDRNGMLRGQLQLAAGDRSTEPVQCGDGNDRDNTLRKFRGPLSFAEKLRKADDFPRVRRSGMYDLRCYMVLHAMKSVRFTTQDGREVYFDVSGNLPAMYDIVNWQLDPQGVQQIKVGSYNGRAKEGETFTMNTSAIWWTRDQKQVPTSVCSPSCPPGFRKAVIPRKPVCCYQCVACPQAGISNQTDSVDCLRCPWDQWPTVQQNECLLKAIEFLSYEDPLGATIVTTSITSSTIPVAILGLFIHYKSTPIVRANNYTLSCLLLVSLCFCFLCSLMLIGYPHPEKCLLRQVVFGIIFSLSVSCILAKNITVVTAFKATKPGHSLKKLTGAKMPYLVISCCVFLQVFICITWLSTTPPFPQHDIFSQQEVITASCNEGSSTAFWCMLGYLALLASISFVLAFLARRLPDTFNEAKYITFSMLAFLSVWVSFIPAYLSTRGKYMVAMEVFAILFSSWALIICIFVPKCYVILLRPELNTKENVMGKGKK